MYVYSVYNFKIKENSLKHLHEQIKQHFKTGVLNLLLYAILLQLQEQYYFNYYSKPIRPS